MVEVAVAVAVVVAMEVQGHRLASLVAEEVQNGLEQDLQEHLEPQELRVFQQQAVLLLVHLPSRSCCQRCPKRRI